MKTIFAFILFLAVTATAPAALQLTVNGQKAEGFHFLWDNQVVWIGIWNDAGADQYNAGLIITNGYGYNSWTEESRLNQPLPMAQGWERIGPVEGVGDIWFAWFAQPVIDKLSGGIIGEVGFYFHSDYTTIVLVDESFNPISSVFLNDIPEPATLALLGLGAMMIRRRVSA